MSDLRAAFIDAATWHGTLEPAAAILAAHPEIAALLDAGADPNSGGHG